MGSPESGFIYGEALAEHGIVTLAVEYRLTDTVTLDETIKVEHRFQEDGAKETVNERLLQFVTELGWLD